MISSDLLSIFSLPGGTQTTSQATRKAASTSSALTTQSASGSVSSRARSGTVAIPSSGEGVPAFRRRGYYLDLVI